MSGQIEKVINLNFKHDSEITGVDYYGGSIITAGLDGQVKIWDSDLHLRNTLDFGSPILSMSLSPNDGKLYVRCNDKKVKLCEHPTAPKEIKTLHTDNAKFQAHIITCDDEHLFIGDDKGNMMKFTKDKLAYSFTTVPGIKHLYFEKDNLYCCTNSEIVIFEIGNSASDKPKIRARLSGQGPIFIAGTKRDGYSEYITFLDVNATGLHFVKNHPSDKYTTLWSLPKFHDVIINSICALEKCAYTSGLDGTLQCLSDITKSKPKNCGSLEIGFCINGMVVGEEENIVYVGSTDGILRKVLFKLD